MNGILKRRKNAVKPLTIIVFMILMVSCGGGEEGSKVTPVTPVTVNTNTDIAYLEQLKKDYTPDTVKLTLIAQSSADLYVESSFNFTSYQKIIFNINVSDSEGNPMANKVLSISSILSEIEEYDDPRLQEKSLLATAKTDIDGQIDLILEIPKKVDNILLELNVVGIENDVIRFIDDSAAVIYHFKPSQ